MKKISLLFLALMLIVSGCQSETCSEYLTKFIQENNLTDFDVDTNGRGFWGLYDSNGNQLNNCLESGGSVTAYI